MKIINSTLIFLLTLFIFTCNAEAKTVWDEQELKQNIAAKKVAVIYLVDGGIGGLESNQYGLPTGEFIVIGPYKNLPEDIIKLAQENTVTIKPSQRFNDIHRPSSPSVNLLGMSLYIVIFVCIFAVLLLINKKLTTIIQIMNKNGPPS